MSEPDQQPKTTSLGETNQAQTIVQGATIGGINKRQFPCPEMAGAFEGTATVGIGVVD